MTINIKKKKQRITEFDSLYHNIGPETGIQPDLLYRSPAPNTEVTGTKHSGKGEYCLLTV